MTELANIEGEEIVIRVPLSALPAAAKVAWDEAFGFEEHTFAVDDVNTFAAEFVRELNAEDEEGTTLIHVALDKAAVNAVENGAEGIGGVE